MSSDYFKTDLQVSATALATGVAMSMINWLSKFQQCFYQLDVYMLLLINKVKARVKPRLKNGVQPVFHTKSDKKTAVNVEGMRFTAVL